MLAYAIAVLAFSIAIELAPFALERLIYDEPVTPSGDPNDVDHRLYAGDNTHKADYRSDDLLQRHPCKGLDGQAGVGATR